ncbi:uncharacterized protein LOC131679695 [Topomyia yanbarensis]|uniref:uncharacterized protein LOC131679695 n=1 Tax=Topomyia yanbarensis TaxID=2498891 RepID=UPI00273AB6DF|nr:uncharacterized protein LOC131679695 [Topomyia yanbarensis]
MSVPRLELLGCVLGVRLMKFVQDSLSVPIVKRTLWTDSITTLSWIQADPRNYRPIVAHRVGEILESTSVDEWRFVFRRGSPIEFFTDNGTNFQGADRILREQINQGLSATFTNTSTKWTFIPPGAPHMGGAWERLVRSVKAAMGDASADGKLDDEGLLTLVTEVECLVNTRPLTYLPLDSEESEALTPNHFLIGCSSGVKQPLVATNCQPKSLRASWERIQEQLNVFWKRWIKEYLPVIRRQPKWFSETRAVKIGDLVLIVDEGKRNGWLRGRVIEVMGDNEGKVRQAVLRTPRGILRRSASKLAVLDVGMESAVSANSKMHPGEDVNASEDPATLITDNNQLANL